MAKSIHIIKYADSANIGDNFQSYTTKQVLEGLGYSVKYIDRDRKDISGKEKLAFINGYYSPKTIDGLNFDFSENTKVIFYNLHLAGDNGRDKFLENHFLNKPSIRKVFKQCEPVGCRDEWTAQILNKNGIKAKNNECITLLLNRRTEEQEKKASKLILVDVDEFVPIPKKYKGNYEYRSQMIQDGEKLSNEKKIQLSEEILNYYKNNAELVITSRFHCAMPCIAMGIPVVFFGDEISKRCSGLKKYIPYYDYTHIGFRQICHLRKLSWSDKIPFLNIRIKHDFNTLDVIYNCFRKLIQLFRYKFITKIDWDVKIPDTESAKRIKIKKIQKELQSKGW